MPLPSAAGLCASEPREASESVKESLSPLPDPEAAGEKGSALGSRPADRERASNSASSTSSAQERREGEPRSMAQGWESEEGGRGLVGLVAGGGLDGRRRWEVWG